MIVVAILALGAAAAATQYYQDSIREYRQPFAEGRGVTYHDRWRAQPGYNLVEVYSVPRGPTRCRVMTLEGVVVLTIPGSNCEILRDGGFVSNFKQELVRRDRDFNLKWSVPHLTVRHDIYEDPASGEILIWVDVHSQVRAEMPFTNSRSLAGARMIVNELLGFDNEGRRSFRWNALEHLGEIEALKSQRGAQLTLSVETPGTYEFSHFNSIDVLPHNRWEKEWPAFKKGNILTSSTTCGGMAIIARESGAIGWFHRTKKAEGARTAQPENYRTHSAHWLESGNILFFQNSREDDEPGQAFSEVIEIQPTDHQEVWSYRAQKGDRFFGDHLGSAYRLANGNTLISSLANGGNAFEVSREGRLVWEWNNSVEDPQFPGSIYRVRRLSEALIEPLLKVLRPQAIGIPDPFNDP